MLRMLCHFTVSCSCSKCEMSDNPNDNHHFHEVVSSVYPFWVKIIRAFQGNLLLFLKTEEIILYLKYEVCGFFFFLPPESIYTYVE